MYLRFWAVACDEDDCHAIHEAYAANRLTARKQAKSDGWLCRGGQAWCPQHEALH